MTASVATAESHARDRVQHARAVLARAEARTGTRSWVPSGHLPAVLAEAHTAADGGGLAVPVRGTGRPPVGISGSLPVPHLLTPLLPGLDRGSTVVVTGSTSLTLSLLAEVSRAGTWVALVGMPRVGVLFVHQLGLDLSKLVLVPEVGPDGPVAVASLLDGLGAVVVGDAALSDSDRRRLSARARERGAVLLSTAPWPGAQLVLAVESSRWEGLGQGDGRLRSRRMTVRGAGRGAASRGWRAEVVLPVRADAGAGAWVADGLGASQHTVVPLLGRRAG